MKPNIFKLATKELSQDSFFAWLLQWADETHCRYNPNLNETAKDFIRMLIGESEDYQITKVEAGRQWHNIDVWAKINEEYFLGIEDKTNTGEHHDQLQRLKEIVAQNYGGTNYKFAFVYLKTGNESSSTLNEISKKGFLVVGRKAVLAMLNFREIQSEVFNDFKEYLTNIETLTNSYTEFENIISDWKAAEGFYLKLEELLPEWTEWRYVSNPTGGFLGFWYHWTETESFALYIQIENYFGNGIKLVVKIGNWEPNTNTLYEILSDLKSYSEKYSLDLKKPNKFRAGETSTLAIIENAFRIDNDDNLDINLFLETLRNVEHMLDDYAITKNQNKTLETELISISESNT